MMMMMMILSLFETTSLLIADLICLIFWMHMNPIWVQQTVGNEIQELDANVYCVCVCVCVCVSLSLSANKHVIDDPWTSSSSL
jgi:hypothetical protein